MGHCLSCILPRRMVRCKTKAGGIFSPLPPANRRHMARRAFRLYAMHSSSLAACILLAMMSLHCSM